MSLWRFLFPSFERPALQRQHLQLEPGRRRASGIWAVVGLSAACGGILLALPAAPQRPTTPPSFLVTAPVKAEPDTSASTASTDASNIEPLAADGNSGDLSLMQLSTLCGADRPTARRVCAEAKAARDAKLEEAAAQAKAKARAEEMAAMAAKIAADAHAEAVAATGVAADAAPENAASQQKSKPTHVADKRPIEQLVHVYDQVTRDGRVVPVYRRSDGGYQFGAPQDYAPEDRRAELQPRGFLSFFGLR